MTATEKLAYGLMVDKVSYNIILSTLFDFSSFSAFKILPV